jgi:hypothetical protein
MDKDKGKRSFKKTRLLILKDGEEKVLAEKNGFVLRFGGLYTSNRLVLLNCTSFNRLSWHPYGTPLLFKLPACPKIFH